MIERYSLLEMQKLWEPTHYFSYCLEIEIVIAEVMAELGQIPQKASLLIRENATFDTKRIVEIEKRTQHDFLAFLESVSESLGEESKYVHLGLTSNDVKDTALALQLRDAGILIQTELEQLIETLSLKAVKYKKTMMMGRSHGIHAEPITFGLKLAVWVEECKRQQSRLEHAIQDISVGQFSGAVGTYASIDPKVEEMACVRLGLVASPISNQIIQRDRHAFFVCVLANIASTLDKMATEFRNLQRTEILEVEEFFGAGQKGSSAMPHKKNPITSEQISGLSRVVRSHVQVALENVPLWHERDITHSSAERIILPDSTTLVHYMLRKMTSVVENLVVKEKNMAQNLEITLGLVFSQKVMLALVGKGLLRETAYEIVQSNAMLAWEHKTPFLGLLQKEIRVTKLLNSEELRKLFCYEDFLLHTEFIFQKLGLN